MHVLGAVSCQRVSCPAAKIIAQLRAVDQLEHDEMNAQLDKNKITLRLCIYVKVVMPEIHIYVYHSILSTVESIIYTVEYIINKKGYISTYMVSSNFAHFTILDLVQI